MRKKLLSLLLVLCMLLALAPAALADGDRHFTDLPHADVDWEDMTLSGVTEAQFNAAVAEVKTLMKYEVAQDKVLSAFHVVVDLYMSLTADLTILNIRKSQDVTDEESKTKYDEVYDILMEIQDPFLYLVQDLVKSALYKDYFIVQEGLTESDVAYYLAYGGTSEEEKALSRQLVAAENAYWESSAAGDLEGMAESYMTTIGLYDSMMDLTDAYDNYADYAYANVYGRDFTTEEAQDFFTAVKTYIVPLISVLQSVTSNDQLLNRDGYFTLNNTDFTTDETLDAITPYIQDMSDELLMAWSYMLDHHLYDIEVRETKNGEGFTTRISKYGAPFFFNAPEGGFRDFTTIIHEFGHYDNFYWHPSGWNDGSCSYDVAEVHSQAMELLFTQYYDDLFGEDVALTAEDDVLSRILLSGVLVGSLLGELELYAYTTPDVTLDMINTKYLQLVQEYGLTQYTLNTPYYFLTVHHLTTQPLYYISYATSAIGALAFYDIAITQGYDVAVDEYLDFVSEPYYSEFQDQFERICGVNPLDPEYIATLTANLVEKLDLIERAQPVQIFSDIPVDHDYYDLITTLYANFGISGTGDGAYHPNDPTTRAEIAQVIYNVLCYNVLGGPVSLPGSFSDVSGTWYEDAANLTSYFEIFSGTDGENGEVIFDGEGLVTLEMMFTLMYRTAIVLGGDVSVDQEYTFADADQVSDWAYDAMQWAVDNGFVGPTAENLIRPQAIVSRTNLAIFGYNLLYLLYVYA